jgi:hypothetical protein
LFGVVPGVLVAKDLLAAFFGMVDRLKLSMECGVRRVYCADVNDEMDKIYFLEVCRNV